MEKLVKSPNKGKRKIPIEPITNKTRKQVTFSKRRGGLFKKGSELSSLCGADLAIITFSGAGKFFGFGHPSADNVIHRFINSSPNNNILSNEHDNSNINNNNGDTNSNSSRSTSTINYGKFSQEYKNVIGQIEAEKKASSSSTNINFNLNDGNDYYCNNNNNGNGGFWWDENVDDLGVVELERFMVALEGLRNEVATRIDEIHPSSMRLVPQNFDFGTRDANAAATRVDDINSSSMSLVAQNNFDFGTRDGNTVPHYQGQGQVQGQSHGFTYYQGQGHAHGQGFDGSTSCWIDHGSVQENIHPMPEPVDSFYEMLVSKLRT